MRNEDARKLALSTLRFEQYPKAQRHEVPSPYPIPSLDPSLSLRMTPPFLLSAVHLPTKILTTNHQPRTTLLYFSHGIHRNGA